MLDESLLGQCFYEQTGDIWLCVEHGQNSKHDVDTVSSLLPCLAIDPWPLYKTH